MKKVLEIGCGQGFQSSRLAKSHDVVGIDFSLEDIKVAKKRYPSVNFRFMDAEALSFSDEQFDEIYAMDVLEHVDSIDSVIQEMSRVTKKGGQAIVNVPAAKSEKWLLKMRPTYFEEIHHMRVFKDMMMEELFLGNGFVLVSRKSRDFLQHIELCYMFKRSRGTVTQLGIGNWRDSWDTKLVHAIMLFFDPIVLETPAKFLPFWVLTVPLGYVINGVGNQFFPKSILFRFQKT